MNIEPDAIETYQSTTTLLLAFKLAEAELMPKQKGTIKAAKARIIAVHKIANRIRYTALQLLNSTSDETLKYTLSTIVAHKSDKKVVQTLTLTFNTMKRDNMI